jgi:hypothetical protein
MQSRPPPKPIRPSVTMEGDQNPKPPIPQRPPPIPITSQDNGHRSSPISIMDKELNSPISMSSPKIPVASTPLVGLQSITQIGHTKETSKRHNSNGVETAGAINNLPKYAGSSNTNNPLSTRAGSEPVTSQNQIPSLSQGNARNISTGNVLARNAISASSIPRPASQDFVRPRNNPAPLRKKPLSKKNSGLLGNIVSSVQGDFEIR